MAKKLLILVGTKKGAFIVEGERKADNWKLRGPFCETWPINHMIADPATATIYAAGGNEWFGPAVWKSTDFGESWSHSSEGLSYPAGETPVKSAWSLALGHDTLYAGVEPAGLFQSKDQGITWRHVEGLTRHPSRPHWQAGGGGLILHSIVPHPRDAQQIWVAISAVGVFYSGDGGKNWETRNQGTRCDFMPEGQRYPDYGQCVHCLVMAPGAERLYQQNHCGMYRSDDGGRTWESIEKGLPSTFGFPAAAHPRDPASLFLLPLNGDSAGRFVPEGKAAVWRTQDGGEQWQAMRNGLPQKEAYFGSLRQAMATDSLDPAGVYFGTNTGVLFGSADEGDSWECIAQFLPPIYSVETMVLAD